MTKIFIARQKMLLCLIVFFISNFFAGCLSSNLIKSNDNNEINTVIDNSQYQPGLLRKANLFVRHEIFLAPQNPKLYFLYLNNQDIQKKRQLKNLIQQDSKRKIVFQFVQNDDGKLTLIARAGRKDHKAFDNNFETLGVSDLVDPPVSIANKKVIFGDQEISRKNENENEEGYGDLGKLRSVINSGSVSNADYNYIIFKPVLVYDDDAGIYSIEFEVGHSSTLVGLNDAAKWTQAITPFNFKTKPSPPYDGY